MCTSSVSLELTKCHSTQNSEITKGFWVSKNKISCFEWASFTVGLFVPWTDPW